MKILVTGARGFIGSNLCPYLEAAGHVVHQLDWVDKQGTLHYAHDLRKPGYFHNCLRGSEPDRVIHLAAQVGREFGEDDAVNTVSENAQLTTQVAIACGEEGVPLTYVSTSEIYGDQGQEICYENSPQSLPHNLYGLTKRWGEEVARLYALDDLQIIRPSMPYGPGAPPGRGRRALDNFLWQAYHRTPITVHRGAERSWCWIGDLCEAFRLVIESGASGAWNAGRDDDYVTMEDLARQACDLTGAPHSLIQIVDAPKNQTVVKRLSTEKLWDLGWKPKTPLDKGLPIVLDWVKKFDQHGNRIEEPKKVEQKA